MESRSRAGLTETSERHGRRLIAQTFLSMDGVMQAPGGQGEDPEGGFPHGGWSMTYWDATMGEAMNRFMAEPHDLLLGRRTYDLFAAFWPQHRDQPGASSLNDATKYVASRTLLELKWENSKLLQADAIAAVKELKQGSGAVLHVLGSATFLQSLLQHDLVDELEIWIFPVVLGTGKRLFHGGALPGAWKLTRTGTSSTGVLLLHYERAGRIVYGKPPGM